MSRDLSKIFSILSDEKTPIRYQLLRNFSELTEPELAQFQAGWADLSPARRLELIQALVEMAEEHIEYHFNPIFAWTMTDVNPRVRILSIEGLWEDVGSAHTARLLHLLVRDDDVDVRAAAAMALGRFIYRSEINEISARRTEDAVEALWDVYHDPREHVHVRRRALEGVAASSHPGVQRIIENAYHHEDLFMRSSALYAMGRTADVRWIPYLLSELQNEAPELRMEAARSLGVLEASAAVDPMIKMLDDERDSEVRFAILEALGEIGGEKAKQALQLSIDSDDEAEAEIAELAMEQLYAGVNNLYELIDEVLGVTTDEDLLEEPDAWGDFYEDPLDAEIRRLIDDGDALS